MKKIVPTLALALAISPVLSFAASTVIVSSPVADSGRVHSAIEVFTENCARVHVGAAPDYLLLLDGRLYVVRDGTSKDVTAQRQQIRLPSPGDENIRLITGFADTGRTETLAGISGRVYTLGYYSLDGKTLTTEVVVSDDARVRETTAFWRTHLKTDGRGRDVLQDFLARNRYGILRFGDDYRVESFGVPPAEDRVTPPATAAP